MVSFNHEGWLAFICGGGIKIVGREFAYYQNKDCKSHSCFRC